MKKNIIALLLVLAVVSFGVFAADPADATFTVKTTVSDNLWMGVTTTAYTTPTAGYTAYTNLAASGSGDQEFTAFITSWSNNAAGYKITMKASPMKHDDVTGAAEIQYTVGANNETYTTASSNAPAAVEIVNVSGLTAITGVSHAITLSVDADSFAAAATGDYTGTVTFEFTSNS